MTTNPAWVSALTDGTNVTLTANKPVAARRYGHLVQIDFAFDKTDDADHTTTTGLPYGWRPRIAATVAVMSHGAVPGRVLLNAGTNRCIMTGSTRTGYEVHAVYLTDDDWPETR